MKVYLYLIVIFTTGCNVSVMDKRESLMEVEVDMIDLGRVSMDDSIYAEFTIHNRGSKALVIDEILTDCRCTLGEWKGDPIPPQETIKFKLKYHPTSEGYFLQKATIYSNAINSPKLVVLRGLVSSR